MIDYHKGYLGVASFQYWYGSVVPRCALPAVLSAMFTCLIKTQYWPRIDVEEEEVRPDYWDTTGGTAYGNSYAALNWVVGFMVIYRVQQAYARYWQGRVATQKMTAYWGSAFIHALAFARHAPNQKSVGEVPVVSAVVGSPAAASQESPVRTMRRQNTFLFGQKFSGRVLSSDEARERYRVSRSKNDALGVLHRWKDSGPCALCFVAWQEYVIETDHLKAKLVNIMRSQDAKFLAYAFNKWKGHFQQKTKHRFYDDVMHLASLMHASACMVLRRDHDFDNLVEFKPGDPISNPPVGVTELPPHQFTALYGKVWSWQRLLTNMSPFSEAAHEQYCTHMKLGVIYGITDDEKASLIRSHDPAYTVICWLTVMIARKYKTECCVEPPIVSRIFQELNQGHMGFMEAYAVTQTPYPLPLAQMTNGVVSLFGLFIVPIQFAATIESTVWAGLLAMLCTLLFYGISEIARELEDPFIHFPNELPLAFLHAELNNCLCDMIREPWPHRDGASVSVFSDKGKRVLDQGKSSRGWSWLINTGDESDSSEDEPEVEERRPTRAPYHVNSVRKKQLVARENQAAQPNYVDRVRNFKRSSSMRILSRTAGVNPQPTFSSAGAPIGRSASPVRNTPASMPEASRSVSGTRGLPLSNVSPSARTDPDVRIRPGQSDLLTDDGVPVRRLFEIGKSVSFKPGLIGRRPDGSASGVLTEPETASTNLYQDLGADSGVISSVLPESKSKVPTPRQGGWVDSMSRQCPTSEPTGVTVVSAAVPPEILIAANENAMPVVFDDTREVPLPVAGHGNDRTDETVEQPTAGISEEEDDAAMETDAVVAT